MLGTGARVTPLMFGVENIGPSIVEYARVNNIDTIIMGSRGLGKVRG